MWAKPYDGYKSKREWVKCHLMVGVKTNVVTAVELSDSHDSQLLPALLNTTTKAFTVKEICADLAYPSEANFQAIAASGAFPSRATQRAARAACMPRRSITSRLTAMRSLPATTRAFERRKHV